MFSLDEIDRDGNWIDRMTMLFRNPMNEHKILLLLEGQTDLAFFKLYKCHDRIIYDSPCSGKPEVIKAVRELRLRDVLKVYGICDADFDHIQGVTYEHVYFTDFHDLEMMLVQGGVIDKFIDNFTDYDSVRPFSSDQFKDSLKKSIMDACYKIGMLKWLNCRESLNLNFKGMNHSEFITVSNECVNIDLDIFINRIVICSERITVSKEYLKDGIEKLTAMNADQLHICNGHDFMHILLIVYRQGFSRGRNLKFSSVEHMMRLAYSTEKFIETSLNRNIESVLVA
ncbi:DUF4435 domain-containing protein [Erwinia rhapontici]|uniref:DUF4435 domain-containing protein n=1 Tax=Erwinia rhapontici TaxID=55212 RepID=UPI0014384594|nr:DUF4435 domain-containing protein [Erwinia rhapontici]NKG31706.1 DUF4435 domain-containing protein [Erwinia rhapontici]